MNNIIYDSGYISLIIQLITGILGGIGIFIKLNEKDKILTEIIIMETIVQFIEFLFYLWLVFSISARSANVTSIRYFDWFITTPIMLITTILYFAYNSDNDRFKDKNDNINLSSVFKKDYKIIIKIVIFNFFMLLFGLLGELGYLDRNIALLLGTIFFLLSFQIIYKYRNVSYNILDIFSKNFYGLYIFYKILKKKIEG